MTDFNIKPAEKVENTAAVTISDKSTFNDFARDSIVPLLYAGNYIAFVYSSPNNYQPALGELLDEGYNSVFKHSSGKIYLFSFLELMRVYGFSALAQLAAFLEVLQENGYVVNLDASAVKQDKSMHTVSVNFVAVSRPR